MIDAAGHALEDRPYVVARWPIAADETRKTAHQRRLLAAIAANDTFFLTCPRSPRADNRGGPAGVHALMEATRRDVVLLAAAAGVAPVSAVAAGTDAVTPEIFGAKGDGQTNDTSAFAAMSAHLNKLGGGTIVLRPVTYVVGQQHPSSGGEEPSFAPVDIIRLTHCRLPITIRGNGARLRAAPGLRYGRFDPASGAPLPDAGKLDRTNLAVPYGAMIDLMECSGPIEISDIELDGMVRSLRVGGKSAPNGWDAAGFGIRLHANGGSENLSGIHSHHHPADGLLLTPRQQRSGSTTVIDSVFEYNGRQACSITGGSNFAFRRCKFNHTGRAGLHHPPGAGVDIEPEGQAIANLSFSSCEFADNAGVGVGQVQRDASAISFIGCTIVGTTSWAAWVPAAGTRFSKCLFVGAIIYAHGDPDPALATQFHGCTFTDDPQLSPTGHVYLGEASKPGSTSKAPKTIAAIDDSRNVLFSGCHFRLVRDGLLPRTGPSVIYADCEMSQRAPQVSSPRGTYRGTNVVRGNADLRGSVIRGKVTLNGRLLPATG
jgi:hypothetical protein